MSSITDPLTEPLSRVGMQQSERQIGADARTTSKGIPATIGTLVSALARNRPRQCGVGNHHECLQQDGGGTLPGTSDDALIQPRRRAGHALISGVLGIDQRSPEHGLGKAVGLGSDCMTKLFAMLPPVVTGALGKASRGGGIDAGPRASILARMRQTDRKRMPAKGRISGRCRAGAENAASATTSQKSVAARRRSFRAAGRATVTTHHNFMQGEEKWD